MMSFCQRGSLPFRQGNGIAGGFFPVKAAIGQGEGETGQSLKAFVKLPQEG